MYERVPKSCLHFGRISDVTHEGLALHIQLHLLSMRLTYIAEYYTLPSPSVPQTVNRGAVRMRDCRSIQIGVWGPVLTINEGRSNHTFIVPLLMGQPL